MKIKKLYLFVCLLCLACFAQAQTTIVNNYTSTVDGTTYTTDVRLYVPAGLNLFQPQPVVIALNGANSSATNMQSLRNIDEAADQEGFFVLYVTGIHGNNTHYGGFGSTNNAEITAEFLDNLLRDWNTLFWWQQRDPNQTYLTGFSNGGVFALWCASEEDPAANPLRDEITGFAAVEARLPQVLLSRGALPNNLTRPILMINGMNANPGPFGAAVARRTIANLAGVYDTFTTLANRNTGNTNQQYNFLNLSAFVPAPNFPGLPVVDGQPGSAFFNNLNPGGITPPNVFVANYPPPLWGPSLMNDGNRVQGIFVGNMEHTWPGDALGAFGSPQDFHGAKIIWDFFNDGQITRATPRNYTTPKLSAPADEIHVTDKTANGELTVYPNPAVNSLNLEFESTGESTGYSITIFDLSNRVVYEKQTAQAVADQAEIATSVDISKLNLGVYFVKVSAGEAVFIRKFVKE